MEWGASEMAEGRCCALRRDMDRGTCLTFGGCIVSLQKLHLMTQNCQAEGLSNPHHDVLFTVETNSEKLFLFL